MLGDISEQGVLAAITEFDELGRDAFLEKYGYAHAKNYVLVHDGSEYDSKAICGVAYGYDFPDQGPLESSSFSGGEATVGKTLRKLGFTVSTTDRTFDTFVTWVARLVGLALFNWSCPGW